MAGVADEDHLATGGGEAAALGVDLGHQRAGGIDGGKLAGHCLAAHGVAHPVG